MSFTVECPFCGLMVRGVPDDREGASGECPRCKNLFTLAALIQPRKARHFFATAAADTAAPAKISTAEPEPATRSAAERSVPAVVFAEHVRAATPTTSEAPTVNRLGVASFFFGTFALLFASISALSVLVMPMAGAGVILGGISVLSRAARKRQARQGGTGIALAGLAVSIPVLALAAGWPGVLGLPERDSSAKQALDTQTVYHYTAEGIQHVSPRDTEWVDASKDAVQQAGMRVRVAGVEVGPVHLKDSLGRSRLTERCLMIKLRVSNTGVDHFVDYKSWSATNGGTDSAAASLSDNLGRAYRQKSFSAGWKVPGQMPHAAIPMAKWVDDVLVFDAPSGPLEYLHLELPCAAFGATGRFRLEIPRRMISFP
jgi:hypothetical protein